MKPIIVISPPHLSQVDLCVAASQVEATAVFNVTHINYPFLALGSVVKELNLYCDSHWGLRLPEVPKIAVKVVEEIRSCNLVVPRLVVPQCSIPSIEELKSLRALNSDLVVECYSVETAKRVSTFPGVVGVILKASESGGKSSAQASFILLQAARKLIDCPYWIWGAGGPLSSCAAATLGAAGIVLCEQLWLTPEVRKYDRHSKLWYNVDGSESSINDLNAPYRYDKRVMCTAGCLTLRSSNVDPISEMDRSLPLGQSVAFTEKLADEFVTAKAIVSHYLDSFTGQIVENIFCADSPLARQHDTKFPICQGPMTRVSDQPNFLKAVADNGAVPFLALALSKEAAAEKLLQKTKDLLKEQSWGVGLLGFLPPDIREKQMALVAKYKPPFALIAGGNPDQVKILERLDIKTYLHCPSPRLLAIYLKQGVRRFVFEGNECGGHIGPRSSFLLWEQVVKALLNSHVPLREISVLCAGGVYDTASAKAASQFFAPIAERAAQVGVLMGSAYLFTEEIIETTALRASYQDFVRNASETKLLETGAGYVSRCADSEFVREFQSKKAELTNSSLDDRSLTEELEKIKLGRLRIASKGLIRRGMNVVPLSQAEQIEQGMFMAGDLITLTNERTSIKALHERVAQVDQSKAKLRTKKSELDIAIVGMDCVLPGAPDLASYWKTILDKMPAITEVPDNRWDVRQYFDANRRAENKTYSKWGGFLAPLEFDPMLFGIPPQVVQSISANQLLALEVSRRALLDANMLGRSDIRKDTAVVFGSADSGDLGNEYAFKSLLPKYFESLLSREQLDELTESLPAWNEDSLPGILQNIVSGRIANRLDLGGSNFTVDAACATSFAALDVAVNMLMSGACQAALVGAVDTSNSALSYLAFSKTQALSPSGLCKPFCKDADGIVLSEGVCALVLRKLKDAERDGQHIYAVIRGVGSSSDGKNASLTAPHSQGQAKAIESAYPGNYGLEEVRYLETHGTGTQVGDKSEIAALRTVFPTSSELKLGAVKSLIGHGKTVAGFAGLIKTVLALDQRVIPGSTNTQDLEPTLNLEGRELRFSSDSYPWLSNGKRRIGAVNAFGFGGTNYHVVLEGYEAHSKYSSKKDIYPRSCELLCFQASNTEALRDILTKEIELADEWSDVISSSSCAAITFRSLANPNSKHRIAIVANSGGSIRAYLRKALGVLGGQLHHDVYYSRAEKAKVCFLVPGQGSQKAGMFRELVCAHPECRTWIEEADQLLVKELPDKLSECIYGDHSDRLEELCQPALAMLHVCIGDVLESYGITPDLVIGHSFGEYSALALGGAINRYDLVRGTFERGSLCNKWTRQLDGSLAVVLANAERTHSLLGRTDTDVYFAGSNSPRQSLVGGTIQALRTFRAECREQKIGLLMLSVSNPYHTELLKPMCSDLKAVLDKYSFTTLNIPVLSNVDGSLYPNKPKQIKNTLVQHLYKPLQFSKQLQTAYDAGARIFLDFGPSTSLQNLVNDMPWSSECKVVGLETGANEWSSLASVVSQLYVKGLADPLRWFANRPKQKPIAKSEHRISLDGGGPVNARIKRVEAIKNIAPSSFLELQDIQNELLKFQQATTSLHAKIDNFDQKIAGRTIAQKSLPAIAVSPSFLTTSTATYQADTLPTQAPEDLQTALLRTIAHVTGYPEEMINIDSNLESELGVDSIKRVEIAGQLLEYKHLTGNLEQGSAFEELVGLKTVREICEWCQDNVAQDSAEKIIKTQAQPGNVGRYKLALSPFDAAGLVNSGKSDASKRFLLVTDGSPRSLAVQSRLEEAGISFEIFSTHTNLEPTDVEALAGAFCISLDVTSNDYTSDDWFELCKAFGNCFEESDFPQKNFLCVTDFGGAFGVSFNGSSEFNPKNAALLGLTKTFGREYPAHAVRCVDVAGEMRSDQELATFLVKLSNSMTPSADVELGWCDGAPRSVVLKAEKAIPDTSFELKEGSVVLVTGGLRGITAEVTKKLCEQYKLHIHVVSRTFPSVDSRLLTCNSREELKNLVMSDPKSFGVARDSSLVEQSLHSLYQQKESLAFVNYFKSCADSFTHHAVDVKDTASVAAVIDKIAITHGKIAGVIHGAGVSRDGLLKDAKLESFHEVVYTKINPLEIFRAKLCPDHLKFLLLFSSVAARFGSVGQANYSAANEVLNKWAARVQGALPNTKVLAINWGPWSTGMMTDSLVKLYRSQGIELISPDEGASLCIEELGYRQESPELLITKSLEKISHWNRHSFAFGN